MILLAMAAALAQPTDARPAVVLRAASVSAYLDYEHCLSIESTKAGIFNTKDARTVVLSVQSKCAAEWQELRLVMLSGDTPSAADEARLEYFRSLAIGSVTSDLVVGRAGSCGTAPGPYQCRGLAKRK
jgi:hypothetical protein